MMTPRAMPEDAATALKAAHAALPHAAAFQAMPSADRTALQANLSRVRQALVARCPAGDVLCPWSLWAAWIGDFTPARDGGQLERCKGAAL